jgi:hypothetical protein
MSRHYSFPSLVSAPHYYCRRRSFISSCLSPHHLSDNYSENRNDVLLSCQRPGRPPTVYPVLIPHGSNSFTDHDKISLCIVAAPPPELPNYEIYNHFAQVGFEALDCSDTWSCRPLQPQSTLDDTVVVDAPNLVAFLPPDGTSGACCSLKHFSGYLTGLQV